MAVAAGSIRRRRGDEEKKLAAKSKRDKVILAVGGALLLAVLVFEVPKVLSSGSSSAPPPAPVAAAAPGATPGGAPSPEVVRNELRAIAKLPSKDPFQAQLGGATSVTTGQQPLAHGPAVRNSHFVVKDPFKAQIGAPANAAPAAPLATPPSVTAAKATHTASVGATSSGYIVILRSLDTKATAQQEVKKARAHGLSEASILYSSKYTTLRHGYWVVYLSKFATVAAANAGLQDARAHGYGSAYRRPVKK
jgi:SPOR domain